ncbi:hypothetical protein ACCC84_14255 [Serratia odorifera]|uniref:hypothetical protein n=1 Tax=Serratia odorifera TaxID=618 RepID=UPI0035323351
MRYQNTAQSFHWPFQVREHEIEIVPASPAIVDASDDGEVVAGTGIGMVTRFMATSLVKNRR